MDLEVKMKDKMKNGKNGKQTKYCYKWKMNLERIVVETIVPACVEYFRISEQAVAIMTDQGFL